MDSLDQALRLEASAWRLTGYRAPAGDLARVPGDVEATARFADGRVSGSTGCNSYSGTYTVAGDELRIGPVAMTRRACEPLSSAVEQGFTAALSAVAGYAARGEGLALLDAQGEVLLRFDVAAVTDLVGTHWVATMINNGRGAVASLLTGTVVSADFEPDGGVHGSGGCNRYTGSYTTDGAALSFGEIATTLMLCVEPEGVGDQEAAYFAALARVAVHRIEGDRLQLRDADGALQVDFRAAPSE